MNDAFAQLTDGFIRRGLFDGTAVLAGSVEKDLFLFSRGIADRISGTPFTENTVLDISSVSKPVGTASAAALCVEKGWIDPEKTFTGYVTDFTGSLCAPVNLLHLGAHTSGFDACYPKECSADAMIAAMKSSGSTVPPMSRVVYQCLNYHIMGWMVEKVSGQRLDAFAAENIFRPLNMQDTAWGRPPEHTMKRLARTARHLDLPPTAIFDGWSRVLYPAYIGGNAGIFSSASDLAKFARMMLRHGEGLFHTSFADLFFTCLTPEGMRARSFGWDMAPEGKPGFSGSAIFHTGSSGQTLWIDPEKKLFVVILTNLFGSHDEAILARRTMAEAVLKML